MEILPRVLYQQGSNGQLYTVHHRLRGSVAAQQQNLRDSKTQDCSLQWEQLVP